MTPTFFVGIERRFTGDDAQEAWARTGKAGWKRAPAGAGVIVVDDETGRSTMEVVVLAEDTLIGGAVAHHCTP